MNPIQIQYLMRAAGHSMADVARSLHNKRTGRHLTPAAVRAVIYGQARSRRIEVRIAALTGLPQHQLWPEWYDAQGKPIHAQRRYTTASEMAACMQAGRGAA